MLVIHLVLILIHEAGSGVNCFPRRVSSRNKIHKTNEEMKHKKNPMLGLSKIVQSSHVCYILAYILLTPGLANLL